MGIDPYKVVRYFGSPYSIPYETGGKNEKRFTPKASFYLCVLLADFCFIQNGSGLYLSAVFEFPLSRLRNDEGVAVRVQP